MRMTLTALALVSLAAPAAAQDAAAGERAFNQCQTCHVVQNPAGEVLAGRNARTGPNLYGLPGRVIGSYEGFRYGDSIVALGATGAVWEEANFVAYLQDPQDYLETALGDGRARSKMVFRVRDAETAADLWAFIASLSPAPAPAGEAPAAPETN